MTKKIDLDEVRARLRLSTNAELNLPSGAEIALLWHSWEQDVPRLLEIIDTVKPLVVAAREFINGDNSDAALDALIEVVDTLPWYVLDSLGVNSDD